MPNHSAADGRAKDLEPLRLITVQIQSGHSLKQNSMLQGMTFSIFKGGPMLSVNRLWGLIFLWPREESYAETENSFSSTRFHMVVGARAYTGASSPA